ncbi:Protein FIZZY-RELATED 2 [Hibiscus syriacus]|uniref:Protein FIZZY-RELATED 2 n=1 Tax=Hibiscus syriacus TaxID=106335 RepID=A0A6A2XLJ6_HIBSY|nr:Protein FIZZY-RELATED 2 [Hibiscus syriacus]
MEDSILSNLRIKSATATPRLNLPSTMSDSSLHLQNLLSRTMHINRMLNSNHNSSPSRTIYSDRFIPSRSGSNFGLFDISNSLTSVEGKEDGSGTYHRLLRAALFGPDTPDKKDPLAPSACRNIFRPVKAPRKVPRSPYKIWDASRCQRVRTMEGHRLRVGALAWSSSLLSSGSRDRSILQRDVRAQDDFASKLWSQVCGLKWSYDNRELASGGNDNRLATLTGHTYRVIYLAISPDGQTIVTGAGNETLRFWNVFPSPKSQNTDSEIGASSLGRTTIR